MRVFAFEEKKIFLTFLFGFLHSCWFSSFYSTRFNMRNDRKRERTFIFACTSDQISISIVLVGRDGVRVPLNGKVCLSAYMRPQTHRGWGFVRRRRDSILKKIEDQYYSWWHWVAAILNCCSAGLFSPSLSLSH